MCVLAVLRLSNVALGFVPTWLAVMVAVFGVLELLSIGWNLLWGDAWNERTIFDVILDALVWLPWP